MKHSRGCSLVMSMCGFEERDYRLIEQVVFWCEPNKAASVVRRLDPGSDHADFAWFVKPISDMFGGSSGGECEYAGELCAVPGFWDTYDWLAQWVDEDFSAKDMELIAEMAIDWEQVKEYVGRSKPNIRYLYKVWKRATRPPATRETNEVDFRVEDHHVEIY